MSTERNAALEKGCFLHVPILMGAPKKVGSRRNRAKALQLTLLFYKTNCPFAHSHLTAKKESGHFVLNQQKSWELKARTTHVMILNSKF